MSSKPYYSVNIETSLGRATLVFVADNAWDSAQQTWLEQSSSERAVHLRALQASASIGADETILVQFAAGLRVARNAGAITLDDLLAERLAP